MANEVKQEKGYNRLQRLYKEDPGTISLRLLESSRASLDQARAQVVAAQAAIQQTIEQKGGDDDANNAILKSAQSAVEKAELDLLGWVEENHGPVEGGQVYFEETVAKNLRLGRFLTLIVGDRIRQSVIEMLNYVNTYPNLANDVALVELSCYRWKRDSDWPLLVVPSIVARTEIVERSVIQVTVKQDGMLLPYP